MQVKIKATGEVFKVHNLDVERVSIKYGSEVRYLDIREVDLIPESNIFNNEINWEQRRYEIAKEAMKAFIASPSYQYYVNNNYYESLHAAEEFVVENAVKYADALIKELKKEGK